jgi:hypothetical protein
MSFGNTKFPTTSVQPSRVYLFKKKTSCVYHRKVGRPFRVVPTCMRNLFQWCRLVFCVCVCVGGGGGLDHSVNVIVDLCSVSWRDIMLVFIDHIIFF